MKYASLWAAVGVAVINPCYDSGKRSAFLKQHVFDLGQFTCLIRTCNPLWGSSRAQW